MSKPGLGVVRAVIFDLFGVLVESGWGLVDSRYTPSEQQWEQLSAVSHAADKGIINLEELKQNFADTLSIPVEEITNLISSQKKNLRLLEVIKKLKADGIKIGLISNVASGFVEGYFSKDELALFDVRILSNEEGLVKPDPRIYRKAATELGLAEEECLFIDDSINNVTGARAVGMLAIPYLDYQGFLEQARPYLRNFDVELTG